MPKAIDIRLHGIRFEDAMKHLANTPPPPSSKKAKKAATSRRLKK
jgi:hypothetical protein